MMAMPLPTIKRKMRWERAVEHYNKEDLQEAFCIIYSVFFRSNYHI